MTIIEAARALLTIQPVEEDRDKFYCRICGEEIAPYPAFDGHEPDCPWLAVPQIVAAMEAAEAMLEEWGHTRLCPFCAPRKQMRPAANHESVCPWMALVKAMKG